MTTRTWNALAGALRDLRLRLLAKSRVSRAQGVELAAMTVCKTLRSRSTRFDGRRFMSIVRSSR